MNAKKRLFLFLGSICYCALLMAGPVSLEKAQQNAYKFLNQKTSSKSGVRKAPIRSQSLKLVHMAETETNQPAYYVFEKNDGGFIIVSGDDDAVPILGYSDKGTFNPSILSEGMNGLLKSYEKQIAFVSSQKEIKPRPINANWDEINPLVKTHWDQDQPFNTLCPIDPTTNKHSYTGCAAVAIAQLLYYYRWPEVGTGEVSYKWNGQTLSTDFSKVNFEWDKMKLDYQYDAPDEDNAVATLLYNCALAAQADFSSTATNGSFSTETLTNYFRYKDQIAWLSLDQTTIDDFEAIIYHELKNERPVPFFSDDSDQNTGHVMIIDGFEGGYFHINFGWRGDNDGYFLLTAVLTDWYSFKSNQAILYNIQPDNEPYIETHLYPNSSYTLSSDGTELIKWDGTEKEIDLTADIAFDKVRRIKSHAFLNDSNVVSVTLPAKMEEIESNAFENCKGLETIFIPKSVNKIFPQAFTKCPYLDHFIVEDNSLNYKSQDGLLIDLNEKCIVACAAGLGGNIVIPDGIIGISEYVFAERQISSVKIPASLNTISEGAFMGCQLLSTLILPANLNYISPKAFASCIGLKQITVIPSTPPQVKDGAFEGIDYESVFLCVPSESMNQYLLSPGWKEFSTLIGISKPSAKKLIVYLKDGTYDSYMLSEKPMVMNTGQDLVISTYTSSKTYKIEQIRRMQYYEKGQDPSPIVDEPYAVYKDGTLAFYYDQLKNSRNGQVYKLNENDDNPGWYGRHEVTKVVFDTSFANVRPTTTYRWFSGMNTLATIEGMQYLNTSSVKNMGYMFYGCSGLNSLDISNFNTSNCINMEYLFSSCDKLTSLNIKNFDTSNCTNMNGMFCNSKGLKSLDVSHFDTSKSTRVDDMFRYDSSLDSLRISSTMGNLGETACENVGSKSTPCTLIAPEDFNFGVETSGDFFEWKSGYFKIVNNIFAISSEKVELKIGETETVQLLGGNGDYTISNNHPDVVNVVIDGENVVISALGKGNANITITDNRTNKTVSFVAIISVSTTIKVEPIELDFGTMTLGTTKSKSFTVYNTGEGTLTFNIDYSSLGGIFNVLEGTKEYVLEPGESKMFTVVCTISDDYEYYGGGMSIFVYSNAVNEESVRINVGVNVLHEKHIPADAIDLGLPSGTKWASYNIGATNPEEVGLKYAWGETETKNRFSWSTYIHCDGSQDNCHDIGDDISGTGYDVAHEKWGDGWQMPTYSQYMELLNSCTFEQTSMNGVDGCRIVGPNGNSIFMPATGNSAFNGSYWSASLNYSSKAYFMALWGMSGDFDPHMVSYPRDEGCCVRPVLSAGTNSIITEVLDFKNLSPNSIVKIYDASGRIIKSARVGQNPQALDLDGIGKGVFLVNINGVIYKIVKK